jgi:pimeloyl-ACP methyl ester carboxylesterase
MKMKRTIDLMVLTSPTDKLKMIHLISSVIAGSENRPMAVDLRVDDQFSNQPIVLFVHGFKGFKDWGHFPMVGEVMAKAGLAFVSFNFSHDGTTLDQPTDFADLEAFGQNNYHKELFDTHSVISAISKGELFEDQHLNRKEIYLLGHSRGGGISITAAAENESVRKLVTWASIGDLKRTQADLDTWKCDGVVYVPNARTDQQMPMYYQFVEDYFAQEERYDLERSCKTINIPTLLVHGTNDATVPFDDAQKLNGFTRGSELLLIEGGDHTFGGKHPYSEPELPAHTQMAVEATVALFRR